MVVAAVPLQLPAPQLDAPVEAVVEVPAVPLQDAAPEPPVVELVEVSVVEAAGVALLPQAERPRSAVAATASEVLMFWFIL